MKAKERLIVALDVPSLDQALRLAEVLAPCVGYFKVGLELFSSIGPEGVRKIASYGPVMLDLKLHDIPETVGRTVHVMRSLGVRMATIHTGGGPAMIREAVKHAGDPHAHDHIKILGVTVLTSLDQSDLNHVGIAGTPEWVTGIRAKLAIAEGCAGVVSSPREAGMLRKLVGHKPLIVTPGIRLLGGDVQDQKRVTTPKDAILRGASHIVVGRPIRDAADPYLAATIFVFEIEDALDIIGVLTPEENHA